MSQLRRAVAAACLLGACWAAALRSPAAAADDLGLTEDEWLGLDDPDEQPPLQNKTLSLSTLNSTGAVLGDPRVFVMGLFNVGTHLLNQLLTINGLAQRPCEGGMHLWKHVKPSLLQERFKKEGREDVLRSRGVVAIMIVRDPLSWLQSMRKAPYDLKSCVTKAPDWPSRNCTFPAPGEYPSTIWKDPTRVAHQAPFPVANVESVWNEWTRQYDQLAEYGFAPDKTVVVSYESMLVDTEAALNKVARVLGKPPVSGVKHLDSPAKSHGSPNGRAQALAKLRAKSYLRSYSDEQRRQVCGLLDRELMRSHGYHDCDEWL